MKIIISPTKQMRENDDIFLPESLPLMLSDTQLLFEKMQSLSFDELKNIWKCSEKIAQEAYMRIQDVSLTERTSPAIMAYKGIQFQYMAPDLLTQPALIYLKENVRILSGFYGILRPFDAIVPYRLEMNSRLSVQGFSNLYNFWGEKLYRELTIKQEPIINLASIEYSKVITPYLKETDCFIDIHFKHLIDGKLKVKPTLAKMARGEMVRFLADNQIITIDDIKQFDHPHYRFSEKESTKKQFVFIYQD